MPETDKLAKLIAHRQAQEKKNDRLRVHKNKLEVDRLQVQVSYLDSNKRVRNREFVSLEGDYIRKLGKIYDRQLHIEERRIKQEKAKREEKEARKQRLESVVVNEEAVEREKKKQLHGVKQIQAKSFMTKVKTLSSGYRDNDPPQIYYKRHGLIPPERMVDPETSASAQVNYGGGWRYPPSYDHLLKPVLPKSTPYGIKEPTERRKYPSTATRSRTSSVNSRSEQTSHLMTSSDEEDMNDAFIDEVISVNVRPSTAPGNRLTEKNISNIKRPNSVLVTHTSNSKLYDRLSSTGVEPEVMNVEVESPHEQHEKDMQRPSTATVHFSKNIKKRRSFSKSAGRNRANLRTPNMLAFRRRSINAPSHNGTMSAPASPRRENDRGITQEILMTNVEQDVIRKKMQEKTHCLARERMKRLLLSPAVSEGSKNVPSLRGSSLQIIPNFATCIKSKHNVINHSPIQTPRSKTMPNEQIATMLNYIDRCDQGLILADASEAKNILFQATRENLHQLTNNVRLFISSM